VETLERILGGHAFFEGLPDRHLAVILGCTSNVRFEAGERLCREGHEASTFFLIREGHVALEVPAPPGEPIRIQTLGAGDVLGWSWLIPPHRWRFDAHALERTRAFALDGACLRRKCEEDRDFGYELLKRFSRVVAERLHATRLQLLDVYQAYQRIVESRT